MKLYKLKKKEHYYYKKRVAQITFKYFSPLVTVPILPVMIFQFPFLKRNIWYEIENTTEFLLYLLTEHLFGTKWNHSMDNHFSLMHFSIIYCHKYYKFYVPSPFKTTYPPSTHDLRCIGQQYDLQWLLLVHCSAI